MADSTDLAARAARGAGPSADAADCGADAPADFEAALAELEALVGSMEDGALPLEASLLAYRRGVELVKVCQERLARAEQQVRVLEGELLRPLDGGDC
ncbi:hypothetical protein GCM10023144_45640 [Pigmentiphaga soli]|uniref:Exodeoxyribonuclease 7 small subunit n=1 Tax=Pigmentiphaga soli TaxID=1007095 RepID=A0ABP8HR81_9BURK